MKPLAPSCTATYRSRPCLLFLSLSFLSVSLFLGASGTAYFDVVDAKEFLHLYCVRGEKLKAFVFMNFQLFFSFLVFLSGVSLKTVIFVAEAHYELEAESGCSSHSRRLTGVITGWQSTPRAATWVGNAMERRQLQVGYNAAWTIEALDALLYKSFMLLTITCSGTMASSMLIGYSMPSGLPMIRLHFSRLGSCLVALITVTVPSYVKSIATPCLVAAESGASEFDAEATDDGYGVFGGGKSLELMQGLVIISCLILVSFVVSLGSLDPNRDATYAVLETRATYRKAKAHLERKKRATTMLQQLMDAASNAAIIAAEAAGNVAHAVRNGTPLRARRTSNESEAGSDGQPWVPGQLSPPRPSTPRRMGRSARSSRNLREVGEARISRDFVSPPSSKGLPDARGELQYAELQRQQLQRGNSRDLRASDESVASNTSKFKSTMLRRDSKDFGLASSLRVVMEVEKKL